ncbi:disease resistance response protein 206-like [Ipomoea triloba]|uniref:disease resistance response protein 206-like n=1 Tax=Ipomoea triloba TaxID=35885 RepID=UPI00125DC1BD|nr:disease resistance response protein 206-like [Ipomoea triloba]
MAFSANSNHALLLLLLPALLLPYQATSDPHQPKFKSAHFTIYQHDTFNKSAYLVTQGLPGDWDLVTLGTPFGSLLVFQDVLTATQDPDSEVVGSADGISIASRFDGSLTVSTVKFSLNTTVYKGTLSFVGGTHVSEASDHPVVGGTGDFLFVTGYGTSTLVKLEGVASVYRIDLYLYWPPYGTPKTSI